jgi:hypothetical protein
MRFMPFWDPASRRSATTDERAWGTRLLLLGVLLSGMLALVTFAQNQPPTHPQTSILLPQANRPPDANEQMKMREAQSRKTNFDAANAERLKQMVQVSQMLETMAIALKAEVDNSPSGASSPQVLHKAETIEKLAHIVSERMKMTVGPN